jgi:hypothetical protein
MQLTITAANMTSVMPFWRTALAYKLMALVALIFVRSRAQLLLRGVPLAHPDGASARGLRDDILGWVGQRHPGQQEAVTRGAHAMAPFCAFVDGAGGMARLFRFTG